MSSQPPKKPFSISFGKATGAVKPKVELKVQEKPDGPERVAATSISQESLARMAAEASGEVKKELVIPMRPSKSFRAAAEAAAAASAAPVETDASLSAEDATALAALKASIDPGNVEKGDSGLVIKARPNAGPGSTAGVSGGSGTATGNSDEDSLADEPDDSDYDAVPIEDFGAAMLRGMGWQPGGAVGLTNARVVAPVDLAEGHNGRLGLGADAKVLELKKQLEKAEKASIKGKPSALSASGGATAAPVSAPKILGGARSTPLTVGCLVEMRLPPHTGLFGRVSHHHAPAAAATSASSAAAPGTILPEDALVSVRLNISRALIPSLSRAKGDFEVLDEAALPRDHQALLDYDYWERRDAQGPLRAAGAAEAEREAARAAAEAATVVTEAGDDHDYSDFSNFVVANDDALAGTGPAPGAVSGREGSAFGPPQPSPAAALPASVPTSTSSSSSSSMLAPSSSSSPSRRAPAPIGPWRWLHEGLRVRLVSRSFREFQRRKGLVTRVSDRSLTAYLTLDPLAGASSGGGARGLTRGREEDVIDVAPDEERGLETVVPPTGGTVAVIAGSKTGLVGKVIVRDSDRERVTVVFGDGSEGSFCFDDVCEYEALK